MADPVPETPVTTQKRPLEEPSSPSGPTDQPDAKRPALDKLSYGETKVETELAGADNEDDHGTTEEVVKPEEVQSEKEEVAVEAVKTDKQGDTVIPDVSSNGIAAAVQNLPNTSLQSPTPANSTTVPGEDSQGTMPYHSQDETTWLHVRAIISSAEAATVIGKGGENVSQIRRMAGAKCTVSEYTRGAVERILTVSGVVDAVAKAFGLIIRTLNQEPLETASTPQSKTYPLRLLIPHILIGSIIGKQGVRIREIQEASGARLNASESCLPLSTERSLVVLGVADAVHIATYYVGSTLVEQLTDRFGGPAASNYASRHGGPQGVVPGGMQVVPYVPQHAGGQVGNPDNMRRQPNPPQRGPPSQYGMPYGGMPGQPPQQQAPAPMHYAGAGSPRAGYAGAGPQQPQPYGHAAPQPGPPQQPMQGMPGQPITQQIFIPNDMVGAIIGKGGAKINEIRQLSGSVIKINEPQDNNNERLVTVTGTQECNQMALYMLYSRLGESSKNSNAYERRFFPQASMGGSAKNRRGVKGVGDVKEVGQGNLTREDFDPPSWRMQSIVPSTVGVIVIDRQRSTCDSHSTISSKTCFYNYQTASRLYDSHVHVFVSQSGCNQDAVRRHHAPHLFDCLPSKTCADTGASRSCRLEFVHATFRLSATKPCVTIAIVHDVFFCPPFHVLPL
nr:rna-binding protein rnc1 [Quercus suber]